MDIDHPNRPWPIPASPWILTQRWHDLLFAHWPVPVETLRAVVPSQLPLDTFEGEAYVGVVPFRMSNVTARFIPALPWLSAFPELNVRTYVTLEDKPGVYFFSLDAGNLAAVMAARQTFHLPYFHARMRLAQEGDFIRYQSERIHQNAPPADLQGRYGPTGDVFHAEPGTLEYFLTERYCLYTVSRPGMVHRAEIAHRPWSLQPAEAEIPVNTMTWWLGLELPVEPPLLHFARFQEMVAWAPEQVSGRS
jgi:uncharacterized protein